MALADETRLPRTLTTAEKGVLLAVLAHLIWGGMAVPMILMVILFIVKKKVWRGAFIMTGCFAAPSSKMAESVIKAARIIGLCIAHLAAA